MLLFNIVMTLNAKSDNNTDSKPVCPKCNKDFIRLRADHRNSIIYCLKCGWYEQYTKINKNGENLLTLEEVLGMSTT